MNNNTVYIVGGGSLSKVLETSFVFNFKFIGRGFIDINPGGSTYCMADSDFEFNLAHICKTNSLALGVFNPKYREEFVEKLGAEKFTTIEDGNIAYSSCIKHGAVVMHGAYVMHNATIGCFAHIHTGAIIGHDAFIEQYAAVGPGCVIGGGAVIGEGCAFGMNVSVLPGVKVAAGVTLGAGAVVTKDITEKNITVIGCPAKKVK